MHHSVKKKRKKTKGKIALDCKLIPVNLRLLKFSTHIDLVNKEIFFTEGAPT